MARILFCTWQYYPVSAGGAERQARMQAEELVRRGHQVVVVCPSAAEAGTGWVGGVAVVRLRCVGGARLSRVTYLANLLRWVLLNVRQFGVVHVHMANLQADAAVFAARLRGVKVHVKVANSGTHGEARRMARIAWATRWYGLRHADSVQALSEEAIGELSRLGVPSERVVRIPNGVVLTPEKGDMNTARVALGLSRDQRIALYVGRFARYKGVADLLDAWRRVVRPGWSLVMVGDNADDDPFGTMPDLPGLVVRPWTNNVQLFLDAADVFVLPSHSEGMSNALLEAMASGMAIVSSDTGAATEMLDDGVSGLLYPAGEVVALAEKLELIMSNDDLRALLAAGARQRGTAYGLEGVVDRLEEAYLRIGVAL